MHEILNRLGPSDYVLDIGSRNGSFGLEETKARVIRIDLECGAQGSFVQADARRLPIRSRSVAAVISNHSLEHVAGLEAAIEEIARVLKQNGALYVAVPNAATLTDRLYRWLSHGGGHVNSFTDGDALAQRLQWATGLPHRATRLLHSSNVFLNRRTGVRWSRRVYSLGGGYEWTLRAANHLFRLADRRWRTSLSVYGWAFYFGDTGEVETTPRINVCLRCGAAHVSEWLKAIQALQRRRFYRCFRCPQCGAENSFFDDAQSERRQSTKLNDPFSSP